MIKRIAVVLALVAGSLVGAAFTAAPSNAAPLSCNGLYSYQTFKAVVVQSGDTCKIAYSTITGSVTVKQNASFETCDDVINGSVNAVQAYVNIDNGTEVDGSVTLLKSGSTIASGDGSCRIVPTIPSSGYSSYICPHFIGGNLNVQNTPWYSNDVEVGDCGSMNIHGSFTISGNRTGVLAGSFTTGGSLVCVDNIPQAEIFPPVNVGSQTVGNCNFVDVVS